MTSRSGPIASPDLHVRGLGPIAGRLLEAYRGFFRATPSLVARAPGRVDLLGAHADYNDGWVLPCAIDRQVWLVAGPASRTTTIHALDMAEAVELDLRLLGTAESGQAPIGVVPAWARYPAGVAWSLQHAGLHTPQLHAVLAGDVPIGAGVSSSAAVEVAFAKAWQALGGWHLPDQTLALACRRAENEFVGVDCGIMDQFASLMGKRDRALLLDCRTLEWEALPIPPGAAIVIADTSTRRQLSDGALNRRRRECAAALRCLQAHVPELAALRDVSGATLAEHTGSLSEPLRSRAMHIVGECERVLAGGRALRSGDAKRLGLLMDASHESARDLYETSSPALEAMWRAGHRHTACLGGRCIGAGFAGCLVFLVRATQVEDFVNETSRRFESVTALSPCLYVARAAAGASVLTMW